ncbi:methyl-accepting chemotaxis protein [Paraburkholderia azotifigens]|uniref:methyl-accepting chemotaxis protein n=1 Tax=Paraburkholderia azotifigens TaxID=2057004 RepID=UPI00317D887D
MRAFAGTIKLRIIVVMGACVVLMAAVGLFGVFGIARLNSAVKASYFENTVPIIELDNMRVAQLNTRLQLRRIQVFRDAGKTRAAVDVIHADLEKLQKARGAYYPGSVSSAEERAVAEKINSELPRYVAMTNEIISAAGSGNNDAIASEVDRHAALSNGLMDAIADDVALKQKEAKQSTDDSEAMFRAIIGVAISLVALGLALSAGMSAYLLRAILRPLNKAIGIANGIAEGKLENHVVIDSRGEYGSLLSALKKMDQQLTTSVRGIKRSTESVTVASREIASGNMDLSARTEQQAASLEQTAASMTELTETVKQNADNAREANGLAINATGLADKGNEAVQSMVGTIERINDSSARISDITGVIEGIAFQTNILALNAAVEAARAGEQGRGFAVVASEVRSLAQRSAAAAKEIKELIGSSVAMIQDGSKQASDVGTTMAQVKQAIRQVSDIVGEIAAASEEQSRGIEQVTQAVGQMDEVTQQNAALVEQAAAAAQSLEEQAAGLKDAVAVFKLADRTPPAEIAKVPLRAPAARAKAVRHIGTKKAVVNVLPAVEAAAKAGDAEWQTF